MLMRKVVAIMFLLMLAKAQAAFNCNVTLQDDVIIKPQYVQVIGERGNLIVSPEGDIQFNNRKVNVNEATRQQAIQYQSTLRHDLPWIDQGAIQRLEKGRRALDNVIISKLGSDSHIRLKLNTLATQLKQQMDQIIEHRSNGLIFHHAAVAQMHQEGERLVQSALGSVIQDSLNEMGRQSIAVADNPLQKIMTHLGGLQQVLGTEWRKQEQNFQQFGDEVCTKVSHLDTQRKNLLAAMK